MKNRDNGVYDKHVAEVANFFITGLENGSSAWFKPWNSGTSMPETPYNPTTGKAYRGGNSWILRGYQNHLIANGKCQDPGDNRFLTYKQAQAIGAQVRQGEKSVMCMSWVELDEKRTNKQGVEVEVKRLISTPFFVFHASQIDNMPERPKVIERPLDDRIKAGQEIIDKSGAVVIHGGNEAAYAPSIDKILMPHRSQFVDDGAYMSTHLHELGHWTGHKDRLNRNFERNTEAYAKEELRAEIASYMMCERLGLPFDPSQHQAYVASWAKILKDQPKEILAAVRDSEQILKHLNVPERTYEILPVVEKGHTMLNDKNKMPSEELRESNYQAWVERYRSAPSISGEAKNLSGNGFIAADTLPSAHRVSERNDFRGEQDKERFKLLTEAENNYALRDFNGPNATKQAYDSMDKLLDYDRKHGHPITDSKRDLVKEPYTSLEVQDWHRRDGRVPSGDELKMLNDNHYDIKYQSEKKPMETDKDWKIHASVKEQQQKEVKEVFAKRNELVAQDKPDYKAPTKDELSSRIEARRSQGISINR